MYIHKQTQGVTPFLNNNEKKETKENKMNDFLTRLETEQRELVDKLNKLVEFTNTSTFQNIRIHQRKLLIKQRDTMQAYFNILSARIDDIRLLGN